MTSTSSIPFRFVLFFSLFPMQLMLSLRITAAVAQETQTKKVDEDTTEKTAVESTLSVELLQGSLKLGTRFLLNNQKPAGNFQYLYDWQQQTYSKDDSAVRQAGAAWGLAFIQSFQGSPEVERSLQKALDFFNSNSRRSRAEGWRYVVYPGTNVGSLGTVALVTLAHLDYLQGRPVSDPAYIKYRPFLEGYVKFLLRSRMENGQWHANYHHLTGAAAGRPSPYFDGESLLALAKAAKYHGYEHLKATVIESARAGYRANVVEARAQDPDSAVTKGYYQWASMAFSELATSDWEDSTEFGDHVIELADWMIDEHKTLERTRNTAYAYEGIIPAYRIAKLRHDDAHATKFRRVIETGLAKLTTWQVGSPTANSNVRSANLTDQKAVGGIQNHRRETQLRIDVTQHQMHAVILALKYCFNATAESEN